MGNNKFKNSPIFSTDLEKGIKNEDVMMLQQLLSTDKEIYPEALKTGFYGEKTEEAVKRFQIKYGVIKNINDQGSGRVGPLTRKKIQEVFSSNISDNKELIIEDAKNDGDKIFGMLTAKIGVPNLANELVTNLIRDYIDREIILDFKTVQLQCTEYVQFRVKHKLGHTIQWPANRILPRDGKNWPIILGGSYKIYDEPKINCTICLTEVHRKDGTITKEGHVAFVEEVFPDNSIHISEVNWDDKGSYNKRKLTDKEWKSHLKCKFIDFS